MVRSPANVEKMAKFIADHCENEDLKHFDRDAVCKVVEYSSKIADNQEKLSSRFNMVVEIMYEADSWACLEDSDLVYKKHVEKAIQKKINRNNMYEEKVLELFDEGTYILDVEEGRRNKWTCSGWGR